LCARQTERDRELVILHDGGPGFHESVNAVARAQDAASVRVLRVPRAPKRTLGTLRNAAVDAARGEYVCQWDDDDRYHPRRLEVQLGALRATRSDASFFSDQLHFFVAAREMYWDDWSDEPYPLDFIHGTLFARRDALARYPDLPRGEDSGLVVAMLRQGRTFARVREQGYLYVYVFDDRNTFDLAHHTAISLYKRFRGARLVRLEAPLRKHIAEYDPALGAFSMPYAGGKLEFK
jgi:glycosyltransferase involved in cell wall biosynthesis